MKSFEQGFTYSFGSPPLMGEWSYLSVAGLFDDLIPKKDWPRSAATGKLVYPRPEWSRQGTVSNRSLQ